MIFIVTNDILITAFFWCKKIFLCIKKNNYSWSTFCDQLFCELYFNQIFSVKYSNRKTFLVYNFVNKSLIKTIDEDFFYKECSLKIFKTILRQNVYQNENKNSSLEKTVWIMLAQICGIIALIVHKMTLKKIICKIRT